MVPMTPRGFRDILPTEAAWRTSIIEATRERFSAWGYVPVETPTLEVLEVLERDGGLSDTPFRFYDSDGNLLALRPDVTLPVARLTALRLTDAPGPFRFHYVEPVFRERESLQGQDREFTQIGIECIGPAGPIADAEVLCLLFETLAAAGLEMFTVAIGTVGVLNALVDGAGGDDVWREEVFTAFHRSDLVEVDRLASDERVDPAFGSAISQLSRIRGGAEAFERCRSLVGPLDCLDGLDALEQTFDLVCANCEAGELVVDFSIISSFDYYTGMVFKVYAPGVGLSLGSGGRYDSTLETFGREEPAAGFALGLERVMQALEAQDAIPPQVGPELTVYDEDPYLMFSKAAQLRREGKRVVMGGGLR